MPFYPPFSLSQGSPTFLGPPGGSQESLPVLTHPLPLPNASFEWHLLSPALFLPSWQRAEILKGMPGQSGSRFCARQTAFWGPHFLSFLASILKGTRLLPGRAWQNVCWPKLTFSSWLLPVWEQDCVAEPSGPPATCKPTVLWCLLQHTGRHLSSASSGRAFLTRASSVSVGLLPVKIALSITIPIWD